MALIADSAAPIAYTRLWARSHSGSSLLQRAVVAVRSGSHKRFRLFNAIVRPTAEGAPFYELDEERATARASCASGENLTPPPAFRVPDDRSCRRSRGVCSHPRSARANPPSRHPPVPRALPARADSTVSWAVVSCATDTGLFTAEGPPSYKVYDLGDNLT